MKIPAPGALLCALFFVPTLSGLAQGSLTPPAAPAPTMKTLDQVEARTIVNVDNTPGDAANTFIISQPGSYYLTGNMTGDSGKHGISIQANDVTLDLNGFSLFSGGGGTVRGIDVPAAITNICIRNGNVRGWNGDGVHAQAATVMAEKLSLSGNSGAIGLAVGNGSLIKDCVANGNGTGFYAPDRTHVSNCISTLNSAEGFNCTSFVTLIDCTSSRNAGAGIVVQGSCNVIRCTANRNDTIGITATTGCTISDCTAGSNLMEGFKLGANNVVRGCTASANKVTGIFGGSGSTITTCNSSANFGNGFDVGPGSTVQDCTAYANLTYTTTNGSTITEAFSYGIKAQSGSTVLHCTTTNHTYAGIFADSGSTVADCTVNGNPAGIIVNFGCTVRGCTVRGNSRDGISGQGGCQILGNTCDLNGPSSAANAGIRITGDATRIEGNNCTANGVGFDVSGHSFLVHNTVHGNGTTAFFGGGLARGNFLDFTAGGNINSSEAWANFSY